MDIKKILFYTILILSCALVQAQHILPSSQAVLDRVEQLQLQNKTKEVLPVLDEAILSTRSPDDLAYLYAYKSSWYVSQDSLMQGKRFLDLSLENAARSAKNTSKAVAYRDSRRRLRRPRRAPRAASGPGAARGRPPPAGR